MDRQDWLEAATASLDKMDDTDVVSVAFVRALLHAMSYSLEVEKKKKPRQSGRQRNRRVVDEVAQNEDQDQDTDTVSDRK